MKKFFKYLLTAIGGLIVAVGLAAAYIGIADIPSYPVEKTEYAQVVPDSSSIALGAKIAAVQCAVCHRGSDGKLSGHLLTEIPPEFGKIYSANITQSKEHGIGKWTDAQLVYFLRTGIKPSGQYVPIYMPKFPHMSETDMHAILSYLHSANPEVQASEVATVPCEPSFLTKFLCRVAFKPYEYPKSKVADADTNDAVALGKYLVVGRYDCYPCHSADFKKVRQDVPEASLGFMGGGNTLITQNGNGIFSANLTPDETGLGNWTEDDFRNAMMNSKSKDGHAVRYPMLPYNGMTDQEIHAIWKYLQTLPKIANKVDRQWEKEL